MRRLLALLLLAPATLIAETLSVAAAANLVYALDALNAEFKKAAPEVELIVNTGASGTLVAQIRNGAPFDVFLSADAEYPRQLIAAGAAEEKSYTTFATGRLVLWTTRADVQVAPLETSLRAPDVRKIAIANPQTAPYGEAAVAAMTKLGVWPEAKTKVVTGENITQTAQFVDTGNVELGFVAMSLVLSPKLRERGRWHEVPPDLYGSLAHAAVITKRGADNPAAARYLAFLSSPAAREIFERFGYRGP